METIAHILEDKGAAVHQATPGASVLDAVKKMCAARVGALLVCEEGRPVGMFTERDLMTRVILDRRDPAATAVEDVMSRDLVYVEPATPAEEAMAVMTQRRCRHLPVVVDGKVVGLVSIGDLVRYVSRNQEYHIRQLENYICGKYPG